MKRKTLSRIIVAGMLLMLLPFIIAVATSQERTTFKHLHDRFTAQKEGTVKMLERHLESHKNCDIKDVMPILRLMVFTVSNADYGVVAWTFPSDDPNNVYTKDNPPRVFLYSEYNWNTKDFDVVVTHEAFHLTKKKNGEYICGPDRVKGLKPVCTIFEQRVYSTKEINAAIYYHLDNYRAWDYAE